jgi:hypothetical protein
VVREGVALCLAQFSDHIPQSSLAYHATILPVVFRFLDDADIYVKEKRWVEAYGGPPWLKALLLVAFHARGTFARNCALLPPAHRLLSAAHCLLVSGSCFVLDCFCENLEPVHLTTYLDVIMSKLAVLSSHPSPGVRCWHAWLPRLCWAPCSHFVSLSLARHVWRMCLLSLACLPCGSLPPLPHTRTLADPRDGHCRYGLFVYFGWRAVCTLL